MEEYVEEAKAGVGVVRTVRVRFWRLADDALVFVHPGGLNLLSLGIEPTFSSQAQLSDCVTTETCTFSAALVKRCNSYKFATGDVYREAAGEEKEVIC